MAPSQLPMSLFKFTRKQPLVAIGLGAALIGTALAFPASAPAAPALDANDKRVTAQVESILRNLVKNPNGGAVNISVVPNARASEGYFDRISIKGAPLRFKKLYVSEFALDARNVKIDVPALSSVKKIRTSRSTTTLRAVISENDLTKMLASSKSTKSMGLKVKYVGDKMNVTGNLNYGLVNGPVSGVAKLRQGANHKVYLDILSLKLRGVESPGFVKNQFSNRINPVIDYQDLPFNPPFKSLKIVGNKAYLST